MPTLTKVRPKTYILGGCDHCGGVLYLDDDRYGFRQKEYVCFQCGRRYEVNGSRNTRRRN